MKKNDRRKALKALAVGGAVLPTQWAKPVVDSVVLPAHATLTTITCIFDGVTTDTGTDTTERAFFSYTGTGTDISYTTSGNPYPTNVANPELVLVCGIIGIVASNNNVVICVDGVNRTDTNGFTYQTAVEGTTVGAESCVGGRVYGITT